MNDYYVYLHRRLDTSEVFYIGHGNNKRAYSKERNKDWLKTVEVSDGYSVEFIADSLSKIEAKAIENKWLNNPDITWNLVNKKKAEDLLDYNINWNDFFEYSEDSPTGILWKVKIGRGDKVKHPGDFAGSFNASDKPLQVTLNTKKYYIHRIVWVLHGNFLDSNLVVNHKDCNPRNNKYSNLEVCSHQENARRRKEHTGAGLNIRNTSGVNGVTTCILHNKPYYKTYYYNNNRLVSKHFSILKYGEAEAFRLACEWRKEQIRLLNEQGAGYTERHGT